MIKPATILIASALLAAPAVGETNSFSFTFSFDRADLASNEGATRVQQQLDAAATRACRHEAPSAQRGVDSICRDQLIAAAVARIGDKRLAEAIGVTGRAAMR